MGCQSGCLGMPRARRGPLVQLGWVCTHLRQHQASMEVFGPTAVRDEGAPLGGHEVGSRGEVLAGPSAPGGRRTEVLVASGELPTRSGAGP